MKQISDTILMIRPLHFCKNEETASTNHFQKETTDLSSSEILSQAQKEFDAFVSKLQEVGVKVVVIEDREEVVTPDSIFSNNWISFHENGDIAIYPMQAESRRLERRDDVFDLIEEGGFHISRIIDLSSAEKEGVFLEGTGSLVLDRENSLAYCALSERSDIELLEEFCEIFGYRKISFNAFQTVDGVRLPVYHTNVVMTIGETFAVICADAIDSEDEKNRVIRSLQRTEKEIVFITEDQLASFAGNMLQVIGKSDNRYLVMSQTAHDSLTNEQLTRLKTHSELLVVEIPTIEKLGGGSARCMLAEVFLPEEEF